MQRFLQILRQVSSLSRKITALSVGIWHTPVWFYHWISCPTKVTLLKYDVTLLSLFLPHILHEQEHIEAMIVNLHRSKLHPNHFRSCTVLVVRISEVVVRTCMASPVQQASGLLCIFCNQKGYSPMHDLSSLGRGTRRESLTCHRMKVNVNT